MAVTEETRYQLFQRAEQVLGKDEVATLMELLPPVGWADVATKRDLDHQRVALTADIDAMGAALRSEIHDLGTDLRSEIHDLGTDSAPRSTIWGRPPRRDGRTGDRAPDEMGELRGEIEQKWANSAARCGR